MSLILVVAIVVLFTSVFLIIRKVGPLFNIVQQKIDNVNTVMRENLAGVRVIKSFVREKKEREKFDVRNTELRDTTISAFRIVTLIFPVLIIIMNVVTVIILWRGGHMVFENIMPTGDLMAYITYLTQILMSLMMVSMVFVMISLSLASARRISEVLNEQSTLHNPKEPLYDVPDGSISFKHVTFRYSDTAETPVLSDINLDIKSGETIGIIGGTGSSKSSFVNLISRLYDTDTGSVIVGGHDVREYDMDTLRNKVAVVLQQNVLFSGTILENLRWGDKNATTDECIKACKMACADDFIESFPDKYNTYIEQGGTNVSGGQKQRLCIARALLKKPRILILDDSTSAVDTATDSKIRAALAKTIPGTTKLIIAQRISSVIDADRIIVMNDGKVDGFDTHENLLKNNEIYRDVYDSQTNGGGDFDEGGAA